MAAKRRRASKEPDIQASDHGTPERARHDRLKLVVVDRTMRDQVVATRAEVASPTALHRMRDAGLLGEGRDAERRFEAGLWLLNLYAKTHPSEGSADYQVIGRDTGEMSDEMAWNFKCWQETMRWLGIARGVVLQRIVCQNDSMVCAARARDALDALADHRGI